VQLAGGTSLLGAVLSLILLSVAFVLVLDVVIMLEFVLGFELVRLLLVHDVGLQVPVMTLVEIVTSPTSLVGEKPRSWCGRTSPTLKLSGNPCSLAHSRGVKNRGGGCRLLTSPNSAASGEDEVPDVGLGADVVEAKLWDAVACRTWRPE
jgi:hypothetical protein